MRRILLSLCLAFGLAGILIADDTDKAKATAKDATALSEISEKWKANLGDAAAFRAFMTSHLVPLSQMADANPDEAEKKLNEVKVLIDSLKPETPEAKANVTRASSYAQSLSEAIELGRTTLADLEAKVDANPHDIVTVSKYFRKATLAIAPLARTKPHEADKILTSVQGHLEKLAAAEENEKGKKSLEVMLRTLTSYRRTIDSTLKLEALIGMDSAPLEVESWVNGESLTDADLKGKVVLLDFWAVWCGPCIATFPHLREWNEKYAEKGLVIIGLTRYYNYEWDETAGKAKGSKSPIPHDIEQEMLKKFASQHNLHHRFGIQATGSKVSEFYGVTGIPHVVVIDRTGKIRLMRVGSGDQNAKDIGDMLEKLIAAPPAATGG